MSPQAERDRPVAARERRRPLLLVLLVVTAVAAWRYRALLAEEERRAAIAELFDPPASTARPRDQRIALEVVAAFSAPVDIQVAPGMPARLYIVEQTGRIRIVDQGRLLDTPLLDLGDRVKFGGEQGLLGLAFEPAFTTTRRLYINYTQAAHPEGATLIERYTTNADGTVADPSTRTEVLRIEQPAANHNGGQIRFGPDGMLWIGMGDGGRGGDPWDNAESMSSLLGKMLRIDVVGQQTYAVPADNPWVGTQGTPPEIWARGLRNPWRFSFDAATGDLWIADVGQNKWEEVNRVPAPRVGGLHFGWDTTEGSACFEPSEGCDRAGITLPVHTYSHDEGCSVTGGLVYRGSQLHGLSGAYLFADFCAGRIWALRDAGDGTWRREQVYAQKGFRPVAFGADSDGELLVADRGSHEVLRLVRGTPPDGSGQSAAPGSGDGSAP